MSFRFRDLFWISPSSDEEAEPAPEVAASEWEGILRALHDVEGVVGGMFVGRNGALLGHTLPRMFDADALKRVGARLSQIHEALASEGGGANGAKLGTLQFHDFCLHVNPMPAGLLGVLAEDSANARALGMAMRLVTRQLQQAVPASTRDASRA